MTISPTVTGQAVAAATEVLWGLSGRRFGTCSVTLRPCRRECYNGSFPRGWYEWGGAGGSFVSPQLIGGQWFNIVCGECGDNCSCSALSEVVLPVPVNTITTVTVDGSPLVTGAYRVDDNRTLVRIDGLNWPRCNNLELADTKVGTWSITAKYGEEIPSLAELAMGELACEFIRAINGEDCRLPKGVQSLARQGVTINFESAADLSESGRLGLYFCDLFINTYNPKHLKRRAQVYKIDENSPRRVGT